MKVSIVIPNWNGAEKLRQNLPQVLRVEGVFEIIVVDDASEDNSIEVIERNFPEVKLVKRDQNGGFSSSVNIGVREAGGDLIYLLNSDVVPEKDSLKHLLPHFENQKVFSVGCNSGGSWAWAKFKDGFFWHHSATDIPKEAHRTLWVSGGSGLFRKKIWDELGGFDEIFNPFYEEDVDLGYRATKRGYINLWEPESRVDHYKEPGVISVNFSKDTVTRIAQRNQLLFIWKNITSPELISEHNKALAKMLVTHPKYWGIFLLALKRLHQVLPKRDMERKMSKLTDEEILKADLAN